MPKKNPGCGAGSPRMLYLAFAFAALSVVFNATILSHLDEVTAMLAR
jgi:hypothetical protein